MQLIRSCTFAYSFANVKARIGDRTRLASNCSVTMSIGVLLACGSDTVTIDGVGTGPELGQQVSARLVERLQLVVRAAWAGMSCCSGPERRRRHRDIQGPWNGAALRTRLLRWLAAFSRSSRSLQLLSFFHFWPVAVSFPLRLGEEMHSDCNPSI
jgi:hypothetical protein